jgi:hypothetical protein
VVFILVQALSPASRTVPTAIVLCRNIQTGDEHQRLLLRQELREAEAL